MHRKLPANFVSASMCYYVWWFEHTLEYSCGARRLSAKQEPTGIIQTSMCPVTDHLKKFEQDSWWRHQMETFSVVQAFFKRIHRSPVDSSHKGQWRGALKFSLICAWTNGWANNRDARDSRGHRAHSDVTVMLKLVFCGREGPMDFTSVHYYFPH